MHKKLSRTEVKEIKRIVKSVPDIIVIESGKIKYKTIYPNGGRGVVIPCTVDKAQFFVDQATKGIDPDKALNEWMEKQQRNKEQLAAIYQKAGDQSHQS